MWMNLLRSGHLSAALRGAWRRSAVPSALVSGRLPPGAPTALATPSPLLGLSLSARLGAGAVWRRPEW